jgi:protoheme IX farnesyltransferase
MSFVIASAGVFNNYLDRDSDAKMERTKHRPLARRLITEKSALLFAMCLGIVGFLILIAYTNALTVSITLFGFFMYVVLYIIWKYRSIHGTLVGSVSGAIPPIIGYSAVSHQLDGGACILFMILVLWQMPHFFAIALYRLEEYKAASIPVLPAKRGILATKRQMLLYISAFLAAALLPTFFHYTGYAYFTAVSACGVIWLGLCMRGFSSDNDRLWARNMFRFSLVVITVLCLMIPFDIIQS